MLRKGIISLHGASVGYGPHSAVAKARAARENAAMSANSRSTDVMKHITNDSNLGLRLALAGLTHPHDLRANFNKGELRFQSPEWRGAMIRLYRCILRLHNKPVTVSLDKSRAACGGPAEAIRAASGVRPREDAEAKFVGKPSQEGPGAQASDEQFFQRFLLTDQQREFGNVFVHGEFQRHMDADAISALTFYEGWYDYILQLASGITARELTDSEKRLLSPEQKEKLKELRGAMLAQRAAQEPGYML